MNRHPVWHSLLQKAWIPLAVMFFVAVVLLHVSWVVRASYSRDENMYLAGAQLFAQGLVPYRDFHFTHQPYLLPVFALATRWTEYPLLAARLLSALFASGIVGLVFIWAGRVATGLPRWQRFAQSVGWALLLIASPLHQFTSSYAWNHQLSTLLALAAALVFLSAAKSDRKLVWMSVSGILLGLGIGVRVNIVTLLPAFVLALLVYPGCERFVQRLRLGGVFAAGLSLALLPAFGYWAAAPERFWFDNFTNHFLTTVLRQQTGFDGPLTFQGVLVYFWNDVVGQPGNLIIVLGLLGLLYPLGLWGLARRRAGESAFEWWFWLAVIPLAILGAMMAIPAWYQRFYVFIPFAICALAFGMEQLAQRIPSRRGWVLFVFIELVLASALFQASEFRRITFIAFPGIWRPVQVHTVSEQIKAQISGGGKILTISPVFVVEAGLPIYPEFAAGPFIWRISDMIDETQMPALKVIAPDALDAFLEQDPPEGILVGAESAQESAFVAYAQRQGYKEVVIGDNLRLWVLSK